MSAVVVTCFTIGAVTARVVTVVLSGCLLPTLCVWFVLPREESKRRKLGGRREDAKDGRISLGLSLSFFLSLSLSLTLLTTMSILLGVEEMRTHASVSAYNIQLLVSMCTSSFSSSVPSFLSPDFPSPFVIGYNLRLCLV